MVERARIILACLEGKEIQQVAREIGASIPTVSKWRRRFAQQGLSSLHDQPRSGKPATYDAAFCDRVLALLEQPPPKGLSHWDGPTVASTLGASVHAVWRVLRSVLPPFRGPLSVELSGELWVLVWGVAGL
jgi:transposase